MAEDSEIILGDDPIWVRVTEFGIENAKSGTPNLAQIQEAVDGYVQSVERFLPHDMKMQLEDSRMYGREIKAIYVNEEGAMRSMPYNPFASAICGFHVVGPMVIAFKSRWD
tara:strand:+ start:1137 stop:1469 length:333 start_codon:yes stop_codon:yes gene_type:complete